MIRHLLNNVGLDPERIRFAHISAAEGTIFAKLVNNFVDELRSKGPNPLRVMNNAEILCS